MKTFAQFTLILFLLCFTLQMSSQDNKQYKIHTLAFYNLENLFDTVDDPIKNDEASPIMEFSGNRKDIYQKKVSNMARVVADIGSDMAKNAPAIVGVVEIENKTVLEDLVNDPMLKELQYGIVHYNSPDYRGIDVALLYRTSIFIPTHTSTHELKIFDDNSKKRSYTRDQLLVSGKLDDDTIHIIVNHWPSRRGGEARSRPKRIAAAKLNKRIIDSLQSIDPYAKIITMGDLNDDPTNASLKKVLNAKANKAEVGFKGIYNPFENQFKKDGLGTTAYRDAWSLFDQILVSQSLIGGDFSTYKFWKAGIFNKPYLTNKRGRFQGYPLRSFADGGFTNGFSDHFPVYIYLIKAVNN